MHFFKTISEMDKKFSWSFFGFLLAFTLALLALYDRFIKDKNPKLYFDVLTSTSVIDIKEELPKLNISFDGIDIREQNLSLQILSVKVINESTKDILKVYYDGDDPLGLKVSAGKIIRADILDSSNEYLQKNLNFSSITDDIIHFKSVILEAHQYFVIKLLVLHKIKDSPSVIPIGHISGVNKIIVREPYKERTEKSFWLRTFSGSLFVQIVRSISYLFIAFIGILVVVVPIALTSQKITEIKHRKHVKNFKSSTDLSLNENDEYIFTNYIYHGVTRLQEIQKFVEEKMHLNLTLARYSDLKEKKQSHEIFHESYFPHLYYVIDGLIESGFIKVVDNSAVVDTHMKKTLEHFMRYLKFTGLLTQQNEETSSPQLLEKVTGIKKDSHQIDDSSKKDSIDG